MLHSLTHVRESDVDIVALARLTANHFWSAVSTERIEPFLIMTMNGNEENAADREKRKKC